MENQVRAFDELQEFRKQRRSDSFPYSQGNARALASALSGMSASAGTFAGVIPKSPGFQDALDAMALDEAERDKELFQNIKVSGLADEARLKQQQRESPLDPTTRALIQQQISQLPIEDEYKIPLAEGITRGEVEDDPVLSQFIENVIPKTPDIKDQIERQKELERQKRRKQPLSDIDREFLNQKLKEAKIDLTVPSTYTYGDAEDNIFMKKLMEQKPAPSLTPYQTIQLNRSEQKDRREEQRYQEQRAEKQVEKAKPDTKFIEEMTKIESALKLIEDIEREKKEKGFKTGLGQTAKEGVKNLAYGTAQFFGMDEPPIAPDPEYARFAAKVNRNLAELIRSISGTAASDKERANLKTIEMSTDDPDKSFDAKLADSKQRLLEIRDIELEAQRRAGKKVESFEPRLSEPTGKRPANRDEQGNLKERLTEEDKAALEWARQNPNDPRAKQIREAIRAKF